MKYNTVISILLSVNGLDTLQYMRYNEQLKAQKTHTEYVTLLYSLNTSQNI